MPTLETGKGTAGFTLLEVVAVIALIGLISILALPRINLSVEQVEVGYIGRLMQTDFRQIKNESLVDPASEKVVSFTKNGYSFNIGDHQIIRNFHFQFAFELPEKAEEENTSPDTIENSRARVEKIEADQSETVPEKTENPPAGSYEIHFINGEICDNEVQIHWQTQNFEGSFFCKMDGAVEWKYQRQRLTQ